MPIGNSHANTIRTSTRVIQRPKVSLSRSMRLMRCSVILKNAKNTISTGRTGSMRKNLKRPAHNSNRREAMANTPILRVLKVIFPTFLNPCLAVLAGGGAGAPEVTKDRITMPASNWI